MPCNHSTLTPVCGGHSWLASKIEYIHLWKGLICRTSTERLNHPVSFRGRIVGVNFALDMVTVLALTFVGLGYPKVSLNGICAKGLDFQHLGSCLGVVLKTYFYRDIDLP